MRLNQTKYFLIFTIFLLVILFLFILKRPINEIYIVDNEKLFNDFKMTIEIKKSAGQFLQKSNFRLDSLNLQFNTVSDNHHKELILGLITAEKDRIANFNASFEEEQTGKIWSRINAYVKVYSESKKIPLILGAQQNGNVLFFEDSIDITDEVIENINKQYEGFN